MIGSFIPYKVSRVPVYIGFELKDVTVETNRTTAMWFWEKWEREKAQAVDSVCLFKVLMMKEVRAVSHSSSSSGVFVASSSLDV